MYIAFVNSSPVLSTSFFESYAPILLIVIDSSTPVVELELSFIVFASIFVKAKLLKYLS